MPIIKKPQAGGKAVSSLAVSRIRNVVLAASAKSGTVIEIGAKDGQLRQSFENCDNHGVLAIAADFFGNLVTVGEQKMKVRGRHC